MRQLSRTDRAEQRVCGLPANRPRTTTIFHPLLRFVSTSLGQRTADSGQQSADRCLQLTVQDQALKFISSGGMPSFSFFLFSISSFFSISTFLLSLFRSSSAAPLRFFTFPATENLLACYLHNLFQLFLYFSQRAGITISIQTWKLRLGGNKDHLIVGTIPHNKTCRRCRCRRRRL